MLPRSRVLRDTFAITAAPILNFLAPAVEASKSDPTYQRRKRFYSSRQCTRLTEICFFDALKAASSCGKHKRRICCARERRYTSAYPWSVRRQTHSLRHQRFDSQGRLIVETTAAKHPAFPHVEYESDHLLDQKDQQFASTTRLPSSFFYDLSSVRELLSKDRGIHHETTTHAKSSHNARPSDSNMDDQLKLIQSVRELEEKLAKAKKDLADSMSSSKLGNSKSRKPKILTKKDYLNLVDLYFYSHNSRFSPESSDASPTPTILNDYSFTLSADFSKPGEQDTYYEGDDNYLSPLKEIEEILKTDKLREIAVMQVFIDLLLQDDSSNRALYEAYQELPQPGVAYLPRGVIRLFLQRMSTPWVKTQASKLRYLSLIDDMQEAKLPITLAEWSSAVYLAGRSFCRIDLGKVNTAFSIWKKMETEAGVRSSHVTFNILFDIAVRSGKFALGETILAEMHKRNLRLNRMGRVSLMFYHGLRGDGDGVRKAYHDFVEAGEIVDTVVLNCVIASLINAQEPTAAEQIYQRMKDVQVNLQKGVAEDGREVLFRRHPNPSSDRIGNEMAANFLGRMLNRAPHLREKLPEKHDELQASMPLTPDFTTFRIMLAYHATVSGDLDRMTVLLKDMLEDFDIPLFPVVFQLLFKGFAIHGPKGGPDSAWSKARLDMTWQACRTAIKHSQEISASKSTSGLRDLPSITEIRSGMSFATQAAESGQGKARTLSMWETLVVDLAAYPRERLKRVQRFHNEQFDDDIPASNFSSPFFQDAHYDAPQPKLDVEEGEYSLPSLVNSRLIHPTDHGFPGDSPDGLEVDFEPMEPEVDDDEEWDRPPSAPKESLHFSAFSTMPKADNVEQVRSVYRLRASKPLVCWLLRAYSRITGSRPLVEEVWGSVRKIWRPRDDAEAEAVIKVLLKSLQDCDRLSGSR